MEKDQDELGQEGKQSSQTRAFGKNKPSLWIGGLRPPGTGPQKSRYQYAPLEFQASKGVLSDSSKRPQIFSIKYPFLEVCAAPSLKTPPFNLPPSFTHLPYSVKITKLFSWGLVSGIGFRSRVHPTNFQNPGPRLTPIVKGFKEVFERPVPTIQSFHPWKQIASFFRHPSESSLWIKE